MIVAILGWNPRPAIVKKIMVADVKVDSALIERISTRYVYIDLEVDQENESIYLIGLDSPAIADEFNKNNFETLQKWLICLKAQGLKLIGHNFRRFDAKYFFEQYPDLHPWWVIDTLELSVIVKPLQLSHKLHKDYKLSDYAGNNPLEDARASKFLFLELLRDFLTKPLTLQQTYCWLLSCGRQEADFAYQQLFNSLNLNQAIQPDLSALPKEAIASWDRGNLDQFWQNAPNESFERRLCVAALIAWEYESNLVNDPPGFSGWLTHLPDFSSVLETLRPLTPLDFSYHPYLENFGLPQFRPIQEEAVQAILGGKRPLLVMATGGGKSLCYQLPALMMYEKQRALTVVISPLQALMADQVADLEAKGLYFATFINGTLTAYERKHRLEQLHRGTKGLLYISPEQLRSISLISLFSERLPVLWVIDEAHCISQWGQTFRPDYRYVPKFMQELYRTKNLPLPRFALMTATATLRVREDIKQLFAQFNLNIGSEIIANGVRENLNYQVIPSNGNKEAQLLNIVQKEYLANNCTLIYTTTRKNAEKLAYILKNSGILARYYHGQISRNEKQEILAAFKQGELNVVTATCAFGMGINRPDVRHVIHHTLSSNLENYVQESGRAGRDGLPATCTILFDENDADLIFFLQSLNHLSPQDLKSIFLSTKSVRGLVYEKAKQGEWFWVTVGEIFQRSQLDEELEPEQQDTKIKVALHHLETFGLVQRAENLSTFINFNLQHKTPQQSLSRFSEYSKTYNLTKYQIEEFERLIVAMHALDNYYRRGKISQQIPIELLSDESGIQVQEIKNKIHELKQAGICTFKLPITLLISKRQIISKTTKNDARTNLWRLCEWEQRLIEALLEIQKDPASGIQVNLRALTVHLDPDNSQNLRSCLLTDIINGWASQNWLTVKQLSKDIVRLDKIEVNQHLLTHQAIAKCLMEVFYEDLNTPTGDFLKLEYELEELYQRVNDFQGEEFLVTLEKLEKLLIWLHDRQIIRLTEGLNLLQQALKICVTPNINIDSTLKRHYKQIEAYYQDEARRTHLMLEYSKLEDKKQRQKLVQDYFQLHQTDFESLYPDLKEENAKLPVTQADYHKIIGPLNACQREIVLAQEPAIAVIAGPGSGKTRTIVHRIAYLVKVKRIQPDRILVLAYNRNAVRELQLRLLDLIGPLAFGLRIFTFHGLALALLGRTLTEEKIFNKEVNFEEILNNACDLLEANDGDDREETQINRFKLLGNLEYIFVDEYQDVAQKEYKLIQLVSGKGVSDDPYRSVEVNLCIIGDDDQNIYQFRGTNVHHIIQFETEYKARQFLLVDNYRSTPSIIKAANNLISKNTQRCKKTPQEQVRIAQSSRSQIDLPVQAYQFNNPMTQAIWVREKVQAWLDSGVNANEIAILSREWDNLGSIRLLLERAGIVTDALKKDSIKLIRNYATYLLLTQLEKNPNLIVESKQSVQYRFKSYFEQCGYNLNQPTIKTLMKIAHDLDLQRGYGCAENMAIPITAQEIITAIYEYSHSGETYLDDNAILVTTYHGAKGLEFRKVILLTDNFKKNESERRLFYVGMTRAKEELILSSTNTNQFISEIGINYDNSQKIEKSVILPKRLIYLDLTPEHIHLGSTLTRYQQQNIKKLQEGEALLMKLNKWHNGWDIVTKNNILIGALSKKGVELLQQKNINLGSFNFGLEEVTVKQIYRHLKVQKITGIIEDFWFVVIPKIRVCR